MTDSCHLAPMVPAADLRFRTPVAIRCTDALCRPGRGSSGRGSVVRQLVVNVLAIVVLAGCGAIDPVATFEQDTDPKHLYLQLTTDQGAVTLSTVAPYNTLQLTATPRNALGEPMEDLPAPTFHLALASDSTNLTVTPAGLLQARAPASEVLVIAELGIPGNVRHADTTVVYINATTDPSPQLASLASEPIAPDSAIMPMDLGFNFSDFGFLPFKYIIQEIPVPRALDAQGNPIPDVVFEFRSLDPTILQPLIGPYSSGYLQVAGTSAGRARLEFSTTTYGTTLVDTMFITVTWPVIQRVRITAGVGGTTQFQPSDIRLTPYGVVFWENLVAGDAVDVTFEDPANVADPLTAELGSGPVRICDRMNTESFYYGPGPHCGPGNVLVPGFPSDPDLPFPGEHTYQMRLFRIPGVYRYHSTRTGATGRIIVTADPNPAAVP